MAILRYPLKNPVEHGHGIDDHPTPATDYIMIRRQRVAYKDSGHETFYSRKTPGNRQKVVQHPDTAYIAIPAQVQTSYGPAYKRSDIGVGGVAAMNILGSGKDFKDLTKSLQDAATAALPEFSTNAMLSLVNGFTGFLGLQGSLDMNTIEALGAGRIFNPYSEQIFQGLSFRTHSFAFKFVSKSRKESEEVKAIIDYLKTGTLPQIQSANFDKRLVNNSDSFKFPSKKVDGKKQSGQKIGRDKSDIFKKGFFKEYNKGYAKSDRYLTIPDQYQLRFVRFGRGGANQSSRRRDLHFKIYPSVCTGISVNYTPDQQYKSFKNPSRNGVDAPAITLSMTFTETRLLTASDVAAGY